MLQMMLGNLVEELSLLSQYVLGAHHTCNDENMSSFLHSVNHKIEDAIVNVKLIKQNNEPKPNQTLFRGDNGFERGISVPVDTDPSRE